VLRSWKRVGQTLRFVSRGKRAVIPRFAGDRTCKCFLRSSLCIFNIYSFLFGRWTRSALSTVYLTCHGESDSASHLLAPFVPRVRSRTKSGMTRSAEKPFWTRVPESAFFHKVACPLFLFHEVFVFGVRFPFLAFSSLPSPVFLFCTLGKRFFQSNAGK